jgi:hypothetical protein
MALKLLAGASGAVRTDYYVTLDADVIALCPPAECWESLLLPESRGAYVDESRDVHPHWWDGSSQTLGLEPGAFPAARFGVTPAVLHVAGAQIVVASLRSKRGADWLHSWLADFARQSWWSEYTLYRLALDMYVSFLKRARVVV